MNACLGWHCTHVVVYWHIVLVYSIDWGVVSLSHLAVQTVWGYWWLYNTTLQKDNTDYTLLVHRSNSSDGACEFTHLSNRSKSCAGEPQFCWVVIIRPRFARLWVWGVPWIPDWIVILRGNHISFGGISLPFLMKMCLVSENFCCNFTGFFQWHTMGFFFQFSAKYSVKLGFKIATVG